MAKQSFHQLIQSIAGAVAEAQDQIQRYQVSTVRKYFDEDNRPVSVDVKLPSQAHDALAGSERVLRVPLISLIGSRLLTVKDMEITFEVGLGSDEHNADASAKSSDGEDKESWPTGTHRPLSVDLGGHRSTEGRPLARVTLKVETQPPSEGMARLIHNLDKLI